MVGAPGDDVGEVRNRIPLEDLIRDYNVQLIPAGGKRLRALCPFHTEKTPSFYVDLEKQFFHCFGCEEGGDIFTFVEKMDHVGFPEALEILARKAGVTLRRRGGDSGGEKVALFDALSLAQDYYHRLLMEDPRGEPARKYLESRRINREMWKHFRLGWSLPDWDGLLRYCASVATRKIAPEVLVRAGLARARENASGHYDYFRGRVMFPIWDPQKRVVGFGARALDDSTPKYLNTPKTALFEKGQLLYGLPQARAGIHRLGRIAIMEGYTDAIMAHQEGLDYAVANLGTAFTVENARGLRRLAPRVDLIFDGDAAGQSATERTLDLLVAEDLEVRIFTVTTGKDPCDALVELGGEEFRRRFEAGVVDVFEFKWKRTVESAREQGEGPAGVARALDEVVSLLAKVRNVVTRKLQARRLAERLGLEESDIEARLPKQRPPAGRDSGARAPEIPNGSVPRAPSLEEVILECLLAEPERAAARLEELESVLTPPGPPEGASVLSPPGATEGASVLTPPGPPEGASVLTPPGSPEGASVFTPPGPPEGASVLSPPGATEGASVFTPPGPSGLPGGAFEGADGHGMGKAVGGWKDLYSKESGLFTLAAHVERQVTGGRLDLKSLPAELADDRARQALMRILARVYPPQPLRGDGRVSSMRNAGGGGSGFVTDDVWKNCLRELERRSLEHRSRTLEEAKSKARARNDQAAYLALQRQHFEVLRRLKSPLKKDGDRIRPGLERPRGESEKGTVR